MENPGVSLLENGELSPTKLYIMEISRWLTFLGISTDALQITGDPMEEQKSQSYVKCYISSFGHDPTGDEIRWWLEHN